jgi:hypothetical protein
MKDGPEGCQWNVGRISLADAFISDGFQGAMLGRELQLDSGEGAQ